VVAISHDRAFLEDFATSVVEIEESSHRAVEYHGGYTSYVAARDLRRQQAYDAHERYVGERARLAEQARRSRSWAEAGARRAKRSPADNDKFVRADRVAGAESTARRAKQLKRRLERLEPVAKPWEGWRLQMTLQPGTRSGDVVAALEGAVFRRGTFRLGPLDVHVMWRDRVAIVGANGSGKTTLLQGLVGKLAPVEGRRRAGSSVVFGEMEQQRDVFAARERLLDVFRTEAGMPEDEARTLLAKFGLGADEVLRSSASLSPGERSRAVLASLMARGVNCLVLDEPTNHLDLPAIEQLEDALKTFDGTVLLVSHDRRLLESFAATQMIAL
jgi:ATPase subunit of ABC transporter with duplicated ATPase domains